jgi:hypothetical protein
VNACLTIGVSDAEEGGGEEGDRGEALEPHVHAHLGTGIHVRLNSLKQETETATHVISFWSLGPIQIPWQAYFRLILSLYFKYFKQAHLYWTKFHLQNVAGTTSVADRHNIDVDPDPACHFDAYPDPTFNFDEFPYPDPSFQIKAYNLEMLK